VPRRAEDPPLFVARWVGCVAIWPAVVLLVQPVVERIQERPRVCAVLGAVLIGLAVLLSWILGDRARLL
jgi:hypothetical protein